MELRQLQPAALWKHFLDICAIPHPSGHEAGIRKYLKDFAEKNFLTYREDSAGNVLIEKIAYPGMENCKRVILQGHLDMVPVKNINYSFDFEHEAVQAVIEEDWVTATGTTLGADNGIGVAAALAVLADVSIKHGPLKAVFTVEEETGLTGAMNLLPEFLDGDILLNLDSEEDGVACIGCAGGTRLDFEFNFDREEAPVDHVAIRIMVNGLRGGHSGMDINLGRGNANKIMARLLRQAGESFDLRVFALNGGSLDNAIPREAVADVMLPPDQEMEFAEFVETFLVETQAMFGEREPEVNITLEKDIDSYSVLDKEIQDAVLLVLDECPNGVIEMSEAIDGLVETSSNLAVIKTDEDLLKITTSQRSARDCRRQELVETLTQLFETYGADANERNSYPGWAPQTDSEILEILNVQSQRLFSSMMKAEAIHAGLECGIFKGINPELDIVSFGPDIRGAHSPDERVSIGSVERFWLLLLAVLERIPER